MPNEFDYVGKTATDISKILNDFIAAYPDFSNTTQGYANRDEPLTVRYLFTEKFSRQFSPLLLGALEEIKSAPHLNKTSLHKALLEKYLALNIGPSSFTQQILQKYFGLNFHSRLLHTTESSAYHSFPGEEEIDFQLHSYCLQPFKLFSISADKRRFFNDDDFNEHRVWDWGPGNVDIAPILRKIIQLYIVSTILQDYQNSDNPFFHPDIAAHLKQLKSLNEELLAEIRTEFKTFFANFGPPLKNHDVFINFENLMRMPRGGRFFVRGFLDIRGNPDGLWSNDRDLSDLLENYVPDFFTVASFYPLGRLLLGQSEKEVHHAFAKRPGQNRLKYYAKFLFSHLNLSTSFFWVHLLLEITKKQLKAFINWVNNEYQSERELWKKVCFFPLTMAILIFSPLLILLPAMYGLTALPFTLVRMLCMHGPFDALKHFTLLKIIDGFELIKDAVLFFIFAVPTLSLLMTAVSALLPSFVLTIGSFASLVALSPLLLLFAGSLKLSDIHYLITANFSQLFGAGVILSATGYLAAAYLGRAIDHNFGDRLERVYNKVVDSISSFNNKIKFSFRKAIQYFNKPNAPIEVKHNVVIPKIDLFKPSPSEEEKIQNILISLGKLNQAFYLTLEEKAPIRALIQSLEITASTTRASLEAAIEVSEISLAGCLNADETQFMSQIINKLIEQDPSLAKEFIKERFFINQGNAKSQYQPSWTLLNLLEKQGFFEKEKWQTVSKLQPTQAILDKCEKILANQPNHLPRHNPVFISSKVVKFTQKELSEIKAELKKHSNKPLRF